MMKRFGNLIWRQSRDMSVMNYPGYTLYEIYTSKGYFYVVKNKETQSLEVLNGLSLGYKDDDFKEYRTNKDKTIFLPPLQ